MPDRTTAALKRLAQANRDVARAMAKDFLDGTSANEIARRAQRAFSRPIVLEMLKAELAFQEVAEALNSDVTPFGDLARYIELENSDRLVTVAIPGVVNASNRLGDALTIQVVKTITDTGLRLRPLRGYPADTDPAFILRQGQAVEVRKASL
ncbi:hypothetical protein AB0O82_10860 [Kitasatospora sp. NPDC088264]|uniref:hypothetical protein n=1 Tax=Kitasatospora sp. NPDC088264 TaxID=3155296 RepID=UPI00342554C5